MPEDSDVWLGYAGSTIANSREYVGIDFMTNDISYVVINRYSGFIFK